MLVDQDFLVLLAQQDVDDVVLAVTVAGARDGGEDFLGDDGGVVRLTLG
jgi:hypothetical protein